MDDWVGEARPAPAELAEGYEPHRYEDGDDWRRGLMESVLKRLDRATLDDLSRVLGGYPIDTSVLDA
jgi:hypothetical protein